MKKLLLGAAAVMLVCAMAVSPAGAYFTDDNEADGTKDYRYNVKTEMVEHVGQNKEITISNTGTQFAVKIRARAFAPSPYDENLEYKIENTNWTKGDDGWCYYSVDVEPGETTEQLDIDPHLPEATDAGRSVDIIIVYEAIPANTEWEAAE